MLLVFDPAGPPWSIRLTRDAPWPESPTFSIRFDGAHPNTIVTDRHELTEDGRALTVTDRGFGNVLAGIAGNETATAVAGDASVALPLSGAAPEVAAFLACTTEPTA
ncbi:hypothetical protein HKCCE2091_12125 [Rhodobacterales bacterium HKCCE2091]|nr:hypothetical protein [Rhodobacterales bacterium HKCCE2091]